jgi:hypothetical protein
LKLEDLVELDVIRGCTKFEEKIDQGVSYWILYGEVGVDRVNSWFFINFCGANHMFLRVSWGKPRYFGGLMWQNIQKWPSWLVTNTLKRLQLLKAWTPHPTVEEVTEFTIHLIKLQPVIYLCTMSGWLTLDSEYHVLPQFTSLFDANVNKHQSRQSQSAIYTFTDWCKGDMKKSHSCSMKNKTQNTTQMYNEHSQFLLKWPQQCTKLVLVLQNNVIWWQH